MSKENHYAVALVLPDTIESLLAGLRGDFKNRMVYVPIPHITLVYPFITKVDTGAIKNKLEQIAHRTKPFTIELSEIGYFHRDSNTAYIGIARSQPVIDLHDILQNEIVLMDDEHSIFFSSEIFVPHVTIGSEIPDDIFPEFKCLLDQEVISVECLISSFWLFNKTDKESWILDTQFEFTAD